MFDKEFLRKALNEFKSNLPSFPDGRIDYSGAKKAMVLTCYIFCQDKFLILKRSSKVSTYKGYWNSVAGYIDEDIALERKIKQEIQEEIGLHSKDIEQLSIYEHVDVFDKDYGLHWIVYPAIARIESMKHIRLDWEHTEYKWIDLESLPKFKTVPGLEENLRKIL